METNTVRDTQGNVWEAFVNEFQQRQLRCIAGDRVGDVIHDPRLDKGVGISSRDPVKPTRDPWLAGLFKSEFFD